jgi:hypothetical protein
MDPATAQDQVIRWIDGRVLPLLPGAAPDGMLPSTAGLFLLGSDFHGPIFQAELRDWLALVVG